LKKAVVEIAAPAIEASACRLQNCGGEKRVMKGRGEGGSREGRKSQKEPILSSKRGRRVSPSKKNSEKITSPPEQKKLGISEKKKKSSAVQNASRIKVE